MQLTKHRRMRRSVLLAPGALAVGTAFAMPAGASASVSDIASGLAGPLQFGVAPNNTIYVAQNFSGTLTEINRTNGTQHDVVQVQGGEVAGIDVRGNGDVTYTTTIGTEQIGTTASNVDRFVKGKSWQLADTFRYENEKNPDAKTEYGFRALDKSCLAQIPPQVPALYHGMLDSHPYSSAHIGNVTYVGDAAGNDIVRVDASGHPTTLTVFPPEPVVISSQFAQANGLPSCVVGSTYRFEAVPTTSRSAPTAGST